MFVLHKMATSPSSSLCSFSLFLSEPSSLPLLKPPLLSLHSPPLKRFISTASELQHDTQARRTLLGSPYTKTSPLLSLSTAAIATESATVSHNDTAENEETEKLVLPTNDSSEKLLRIRHTVNSYFSHFYLDVSSFRLFSSMVKFFSFFFFPFGYVCCSVHM